MNRDVVTIGASAGGVDVLFELVRELPRDLPAALFVVVHRPPGEPDRLPELLNECGRLQAHHPLHAERIERGQIYVAPPDNQLLLRAGSVEVVRGPRENGHRPAVDALFRTASATYGSRVIGVVLSGFQDCGTAGMMSIKARGGVSVVQSPESAFAAEMPASVLRRVPVDHIVHPSELASLLVRLTSEPAGPEPQPDGVVGRIEGATVGDPAAVVCPICPGVLTEAPTGAPDPFPCHVGCAVSRKSSVREQSENLERALWAALRALEGSAALSQRLAARERGDSRGRFGELATTQVEQVELIRRLLLGRRLPPGAAQGTELSALGGERRVRGL